MICIVIYIYSHKFVCKCTYLYYNYDYHHDFYIFLLYIIAMITIVVHKYMYVRNRSLIPANKNGRFLSEITQMNPEGPRPPGNPTRLLAIRGDFGWEMIGTQLKLEIVGDTWRYPMFHDVSISSGQCFWQGCMQKLVDYAISFPSF